MNNRKTGCHTSNTNGPAFPLMREPSNQLSGISGGLAVEPVVERRPDLVPGKMRCAKCKFGLTRVTLYTGNGAVGAGGNETEPCPNGCGPLWPVTMTASPSMPLATTLHGAATRSIPRTLSTSGSISPTQVRTAHD